MIFSHAVLNVVEAAREFAPCNGQLDLRAALRETCAIKIAIRVKRSSGPIGPRQGDEMNLVNERAEVMNVITHADESTACAMCGFCTLLIEACVEHNEEECHKLWTALSGLRGVIMKGHSQFI